MITRLLHALTSPLVAYYDMTVASPCKEVSKQALEKIHHKQVELQAHNHFSFLKHMKKQRQMVSPEPADTGEVDSVTEQYVRQTHREVDSLTWLH